MLIRDGSRDLTTISRKILQNSGHVSIVGRKQCAVKGKWDYAGLAIDLAGLDVINAKTKNRISIRICSLSPSTQDPVELAQMVSQRKQFPCSDDNAHQPHGLDQCPSEVLTSL